MASRKPPWWRAFDKVERAVGKPLEDAVASSTYVDVMLRGMKAQRAVSRGAWRMVNGATGKLLHVVNIPTRGDVTSLSKQLTALTREVRQITSAQHEVRETEATASAPAPVRKSASARKPPARRATASRPKADRGA